MKISTKIVLMTACAMLSCIAMAAIFRTSQYKSRHMNSLTRIFPPGLAEQAVTAELKFNSYYFAGSEEGLVYLGNSTAPLLVTVLDSTLSVRSTHHIKLNSQARGMHAPKIKIDPPYFYIYEGSVPYIYKGLISDWKAYLKIDSGNTFSQLQPVGPSQAVARFTDAKATKNILGLVNLETKSIDLKPGLLSEENLFSTDGILLFDKSENKIAYIHYYTNRILITDANLGTALIAKTIDTTEAPELKIAALKNERTFSEMPVLANRLAHFDSGWIYVNSQIIGQHESKQRWKDSSIIDVYDSNTKGYLASFYIDDIDGRKARSFWVDGNSAYVLGGSKIIRYRLRKFLTP